MCAVEQILQLAEMIVADLTSLNDAKPAVANDSPSKQPDAKKKTLAETFGYFIPFLKFYAE